MLPSPSSLLVTLCINIGQSPYRLSPRILSQPTGFMCPCRRTPVCKRSGQFYILVKIFRLGSALVV